MIDRYFIKLNGYLVKDSKAIHTYNNVTNMKSDTTLKVGDHVKTKGYNNIQDGGHGEYIIVNDNSLVEDNGSIHTLSNGLKAVLIIDNDTVNIKQFGAVGDGETDDSLAIQNALNCVGDKYIKIVFNKGDVYCAKENIYLTSNTDIILNNSTIKSIYAGNNETPYVQFANGLRFLNSTNTIENFSVKNGVINGNTSGVLFGLIHGNNIVFENIHFLDCCVGTHILDLGGCENVVVNNCNFDGCYLVNSNSYREMIQIDYASSDGLPYWGESFNITYDNKPCKNVIITNNDFSKGNGTQYPTPIGQHAVKNDITENITIKHNKFYGCASTSSFIRFYKIKDIYIENNDFHNENETHTSSKYAIQICRQSDNNPDPNPIASENINIKNNNFFTDINSTSLVFLQILGYADLFFKNIKIENNYYMGTKSQDVFELGNIENITIKNNNIINGKYFVIKTRNSVLNRYNINNNYIKDCTEFIHLITDDTVTTANFFNIDNNIWELTTSGKECIYNNSSYRNNFCFENDQAVNSNQEYRLRLAIKDKTDDIDVRVSWSNPCIWIPSQLRRLKISGKFYINTVNANDVKEVRIYDNDGTNDTLIGSQKYILPTSGLNMIELAPIYLEITDMAVKHNIWATVTMKSGDTITAKFNNLYSNYLTVETY